MISVVNGFVCQSSCDVEKAKQGKDPNAPPGSPPETTAKDAAGFDKQPATVLGGALKEQSAANPVDPVASGQGSAVTRGALVNVLA